MSILLIGGAKQGSKDMLLAWVIWKIIAILMMFAFAAASHIHAVRSNAVLTNDAGFRRMASRIRSTRTRRILTQVFMQCSAGFRDIKTDPACHKLAIIILQNS